jgi:hypothetical protein
MGLFLPTYFGPISQFSKMVKFDEIIFETKDNLQKQSYRNRCYIFGANGKQMLNIPLQKKKTAHKQKTKDTLVDNSEKWQDQHLKSLKASYNNSPFFEFYEDELQTIFKKEYRFLHDINFATFLFFREALQLETKYSTTLEYQSNEIENDFRTLANVHYKSEEKSKKYIQMFDDKHGFLPNLSMLDLLFMEGPNAISFL